MQLNSNPIALADLVSAFITQEELTQLSASKFGALPVTNLELDSRNLTSQDVFVAVKGHQLDARNFIPQALDKDVQVIFADACDGDSRLEIAADQSHVIIYIHALAQQLSQLAKSVYPYQNMQLVGITGTNGKTTISQLIAQWAGLIGKKAAVMGTTGNGFLDNLQTAANTTGSAIEIQKQLASFATQDADLSALEVSSHGLVQGRVKALAFDVGVFTNLSRDHLDYHGDMASYAAAKQSLFSQHSCRHAVINIDDSVGMQWVEEANWHASQQTLTCLSLSEIAPSIQAKHQFIYTKSLAYTEEGIALELVSSWGEAKLTAPLIGQFNGMNILSALASLLVLGIPLDTLAQTASKLKPVIGRMELFFDPARSTPKLVVDYAHTPDALEKALQALRIHCEGELWCIFGCGGDRDTGKRPLMTQAAQAYADKLVITDDNPRSEDPKAIVKDMLDGAEQPEQIQVMHSRFAAIEYAFTHAQVQDMILIAGKGHEDYQIIGAQRIHYSDRETALELLNAPCCDKNKK